MRHCVFVLMLACSLLAMPLTQQSVAQESIVVASGEWAPYTGKDLPEQGFCNHILSEAFATQGISVKFEYFPWNRSLLMVRDGNAALTAPWTPNEERKQQYAINAEPVVTSENVLFHLKETPFAWQTMDDFSGKTIAITSGYFYGDAFKAAAEAGVFTADEGKDDATSLRKLLAGRVDAFICDKIVCMDMARKDLSAEDLARLTYSEKVVSTASLHAFFTKEAPETPAMLQALDAGLKQLREDGTYDAIIQDVLDGKYK